MNTFSSPIYMGIDLTEKCNLRCVHCRVSTSDDKLNEIPLNKVKELIDEISKMKVIQIILSGGEPFIRKDILEILEYCVKKKIPDLIVVTNGLLLNEERIDKLKKSGLKKIAVSLDGLKESHEMIRGKGTFERTLNVIKKLVNNGFEVRVTITLNRLNKEDVTELSTILELMGVKKINVGNLIPCGRGKKLWAEILDKNEKKELLNKSKQINKKYGKNLISFESSFLQEPNVSESEKKIIPYLGCRGGRTYCAILANGDVVACKMLPHIIAGNIYKDKFSNIWRNDKNWNIWRENKLSKKCSICKYGDACRGGCRALSFYKFGREDLPDPRCIGPFT